jgi:HPr kinase/phosphorylase
MLNVHATCICFDGKAVLIRGASGSGKSSLALQLLESVGTGLGAQALQAQLVADDQTVLVVREKVLFASPPQTLAGLLEVRGQNIKRLPYDEDVPVVLVVDLRPAQEIERLPEEAHLVTEILGVKVACVAIDTAHPSAAARLRVAFVRVQNT